MRAFHALVLALLAGACGAAGEPADADGPPDAPYRYPAWEQVYVNPPELATGTFDFNPLINVPPDAPDDVEDAFSLVTWPEREAVPFHLDRWPGVPEPFRTTEMIPDESLSDRWYAISVVVPTGVEFVPDMHPDGPGRFVNRFRVGNQLILTAARLTRSEAGADIQLVLSERVGWSTTSPPFGVTTSSGAVGCSVENGAQLSSADGSTVMDLRCAPIDAGDHVEIVAIASLTGLASGLPLTQPDGTEPARIDMTAGDELGVTVLGKPPFD